MERELNLLMKSLNETILEDGFAAKYFLYGPPGCGKTHIINRIAEWAKENHLWVVRAEPSVIMTSYAGKGEKEIARIFKEAADHQPAMIILDDADTYLRHRKDANVHEMCLATVMLEMLANIHNTVVLLATYSPSFIDEAALRSANILFVGQPSFEERVAIIESEKINDYLAPELSADFVAKTTDGYSGRELLRMLDDLKYDFKTKVVQMVTADGDHPDAETADNTALNILLSRKVLIDKEMLKRALDNAPKRTIANYRDEEQRFEASLSDNPDVIILA